MRIASVGYASEQGLGHLIRWFFDAGLITDPLLVRHPRHPYHPEWYPPGTPEVNPRDISGPAVDEILGRVQWMLFWESPFDWSLLNRCREWGVKTALCVMYEWYPERPPATPDLIIAPSLLDRDYFPGSVFLPIPASPWVKWQQREKTLRFLHNAGHIGHREHKGTRQLLEALPYVHSPIHLTVRCQYKGMVEQMTESALLGSNWYRAPNGDSMERLADGSTIVGKDFVASSGARLSIVSGYLPYESLWNGFDVYVAPEKLNGLSLPLQEAHAAGLLVMTTDRYPANTWLPKSPLIPVSRYSRGVRIAGPYLPFDEAVVEPKTIAEVIDRWYGQDVAEFSLAGRDWAERHSWEVMLPKWREALAS